MIAPVALLLAAALVGVSGGGLGGLGQIATGPSLPDTDLPAASKTSLADAEIAAVDVGAEPRARSPEPTPRPVPESPVDSGALASAAPPVPRPSPLPVPAQAPPRRVAVTPPRPSRPVVREPPVAPQPPPDGFGAPQPAPASPRRPNLLEELDNRVVDPLLEKNLLDTLGLPNLIPR